MDQPLDITLDKADPVPLYLQLAAQIERAITSGRLAPGDRIANEVDLAHELNLARPTVRRAIHELVDKGLLVRKRGVGTQVVPGQVTRSVELTSLYDDLVAAGAAPTTRVLVLRNAAVPDDAATALMLVPGARVLYLERLRYAGGEPLALLRNWLPLGLLSPTAADLEAHGLYELMRAAGVRLRIARQRIGAKPASSSESRLLQEPRNAPLLTITRTTFDDSGHAVEYGAHSYRARMYAFETTLVHR